MTWGAVLGLMAMVFFASWPVWKAIKFKSVNTATYARTKAEVEKTPRLQPAWGIALQDDLLTWPEAKVILERPVRRRSRTSAIIMMLPPGGRTAHGFGAGTRPTKGSPWTPPRP
jgi:hypothetical protein